MSPGIQPVALKSSLKRAYKWSRRTAHEDNQVSMHFAYECPTIALRFPMDSWPSQTASASRHAVKLVVCGVSLHVRYVKP